MTSPNILSYGRAQALPEPVELRAGPLSLLYEAGDLRYIRLGQIEILRRVYTAVRDHNWDTITPNLSNEQFTINADSFQITYDAAHQRDPIDFFWQAVITGDADGTITFTMRGQARSTFRRNRIGFCVLHPMTCAGLPARVEHDNGALEACSFPVSIAPQLVKDGHPWPVAPFDSMRALAHQVLPDLWAEVRFAGDIFEMEDQRNWTDASYKTYCTPLALPYPLEIAAGTEIVQSIRLSLSGPLPPAKPASASSEITFSRSKQPGRPLPNIGLGTASHGQPLSAQAIERLKALRLSHLRIDLQLSDPAYITRLRTAASEARAIDAALEIALFVSDAAQAELAGLRAELDRLHPPVLHWLIFHQKEKTTSARWIELARQYLSDLEPAAAIGAGTNAYFTEINANHPPVAALDLVAYSINPQVHAFDNASLTETLACQAVTVTSARGFCAGKPVVVSPVTLKARFNPNASGPQPAAAPGQLPAQVDPRQSSLYGLAWTLGSLKYLAESAVSSVTYYETSGWRGVLAQESDSPEPHLFHAPAGGVYPLYHLFADLAEMPNAHILPLQSSQPLLVDGLLLENEQARMLLLANFTPQAQTVRLADLPAAVQVRSINVDNALEAMQSPQAFRQHSWQTQAAPHGKLTLALKPFETVRIQFNLIERP